MSLSKTKKRQAKSPYQKSNKSPFRYSPEHRAWFRAHHNNIKESSSVNAT